MITLGMDFVTYELIQFISRGCGAWIEKGVCIIIKIDSNVKNIKSKWTVVENNISISDNDSFLECFTWSYCNTGFIEFDNRDRIWSPHTILRMIPLSLNN